MAVTAVLSELASRSKDLAVQDDPSEAIYCTPVTHHHFGGVHYYSKVHRRYAWVRPVVDGEGKVDTSRLLVAFGYADVPESWQAYPNRMRHAFAPDEILAANAIVSFLLDNSLPDQLFSGDYPFPEPDLRHA